MDDGLLEILQVPWLSNEDIWQKADEFRNHHWDCGIPVDIEWIVEKRLEMYITPIPRLKSLTGADAFILGNLSEILYDQDCKSGNRIRFSIAEEVGHYKLHENQIRLLRTNLTYDEWIDTIKKIPEAVWTRADSQAREFAGRLLVPQEELFNSIKKLEPAICQAREILKDGLNKNELFNYISPPIAKTFQVSEQSVYLRLNREEVEKHIDFLKDLQ